MQQFELHKIALGTLTALMLTPAVSQELVFKELEQGYEVKTRFIVTYKNNQQTAYLQSADEMNTNQAVQPMDMTATCQ
ncbi:MAG: hypothetical protein U5L02_16235 [Rheinheimera sp.]|nr:hypothetical protein [Rheinheimera sp.]